MTEGQEQVFLESGRWVKPQGAVWVRIELRGGDGSPGPTSTTATRPCRAGSYAEATMHADNLPEEVEIHVGRAGEGHGDGRAAGHGWARVTTYFADTTGPTGYPR